MSSKQDFKETKKEFKNNATELGNTLDEFQNLNDVSKSTIRVSNSCSAEQMKKVIDRAQNEIAITERNVCVIFCFDVAFLVETNGREVEFIRSIR